MAGKRGNSQQKTTKKMDNVVVGSGGNAVRLFNSCNVAKREPDLLSSVRSDVTVDCWPFCFHLIPLVE